MSIIALFPLTKLPEVFNRPCNSVFRYLSRRSSNVESSYKVIKSRKGATDKGSLVWRDPNFELLASPSGFPFFLPGSISPAWYDKHSSLKTEVKLVFEQIEDVEPSDRNIECRVQDCPTVLRQTVCDLFPNNNLDASRLSLFTIRIKTDVKFLKHNREKETENMTITFLYTANKICDKLRKAGFWADFINPFSGTSYSFPFTTSSLCKTDEKFRCMDFEISEFNNCKVICSDHVKSPDRFTGTIFTNAPPNKRYLDKMLTREGL